MNSQRIKKLERVSRELVSNFIFDELEDAEKTFWIITITWVKISSDLSYLDIFVSSMMNGEILPKTLAKHNYDIQKRLNKSIEIRKLPRIRFRYDSKWEIGQEIWELIEKECKI
jgi:ribosome-binding factor A